MCARLDNFTMVYHKDLVSITDCRKTVCNHNDCFAFHQFGKSLLDKTFIFRVAERGCLIQYQDRGIFHNGSCYGNALNLSTGKFHAVFTKHGLIALRQFGNKFMALSSFGGSYNFFFSCIWISHADIIQNTLLKQEIVLEYKADGIHQIAGTHITDVYSADTDSPLFHIIETGKQAGNGAFTAAGWADNGSNLSLGCSKEYGL